MPAPRLLASLNTAFKTLELGEEDKPAMDLARTYASKIEESQDVKTLKDLGPELMKILTELLMTPKSRAAIRATAKEAVTYEEDPNSAAGILARLQYDASNR